MIVLVGDLISLILLIMLIFSGTKRLVDEVRERSSDWMLSVWAYCVVLWLTWRVVAEVITIVNSAWRSL